MGTTKVSAETAAGRALSAFRMIKMSPEERSAVARLGGIAQGKASRRRARLARAAKAAQAVQQ